MNNEHSQNEFSLAELTALLVLALCWLAKVLIYPIPAENFHEIFERASIYHLIPGWLVITAGLVFNRILFVFALVTMKKRTEVVTIYPTG